MGVHSISLAGDHFHSADFLLSVPVRVADKGGCRFVPEEGQGSAKIETSGEGDRDRDVFALSEVVVRDSHPRATRQELLQKWWSERATLSLSLSFNFG